MSSLHHLSPDAPITPRVSHHRTPDVYPTLYTVESDPERAIALTLLQERRTPSVVHVLPYHRDGYLIAERWTLYDGGEPLAGSYWQETAYRRALNAMGWVMPHE